VQQVLINLLINARDAMPQGGKVVIETANLERDETFVHQHVDLPPGRYVLLSVSDTGSGMNAEARAHLFEPFYTTKQPGKGTGLGLATVYGIVKHRGGHVAVESIEGKGTTFRVYLPRVEEAVEQSSAAAPQPANGSTAILVVEDEASLRSLICISLERRKHRVFAAKDGVEGLENLSAERI
jgi:two-component system, cell cycle sensor histidine kinase and response regulator CckA